MQHEQTEQPVLTHILPRQRRALREYGVDPGSAQIRPADVVENYVG